MHITQNNKLRFRELEEFKLFDLLIIFKKIIFRKRKRLIGTVRLGQSSPNAPQITIPLLLLFPNLLKAALTK